VPSGDHVGAKDVLFEVSCTWFEPSAFMTKTSLPPVRSLEKTISDPSGDQEGHISTPCHVVNCTTCDPSAFIT
jgi:hypothetical protein